VSPSFKDSLVVFLKGSGAVPKEKEIETINFETNGGFGMRAMNWPSVDFVVSGQKLTLDADIVSETLTELFANKYWETLPDSRRFLRLRSRFSCLALSELEVKELIPQLESKLAEANKIAAKFQEKVEKALVSAEEKGHIYRPKVKKVHKEAN